MPFSMWNEAEKFYNVTLPGVVMASLVIFLVILFVFFYVTRDKFKYLFLFLLLSSCLVGLWIIGNHNYYSPYLKDYSLINPLTRDRQIVWGLQNFYSPRERRIYTHLNDIESLQELSVYEEQEVSVNLNYLGKKDYLYYFEYKDTLFHTSKNVYYSPAVSTAQIIGSQFALTDPAYQTIGFNNNLNTMFRIFQLNERDKHKIYKPEQEQSSTSIESLFSNWNF